MIAIAAIILLYGILWILGTGCPIKFLTGVSCMGCGMMRASWSLMHGHVHEAAHFHPLVFAVIPFGLWILLKKKIPERIYRIGIWGIVLAFTITYIIRMADPANTVVVFEPQNGIILRLFRGLSH